LIFTDIFKDIWTHCTILCIYTILLLPLVLIAFDVLQDFSEGIHSFIIYTHFLCATAQYSVHCRANSSRLYPALCL